MAPATVETEKAATSSESGVASRIRARTVFTPAVRAVTRRTRARPDPSVTTIPSVVSPTASTSRAVPSSPPGGSRTNRTTSPPTALPHASRTCASSSRSLPTAIPVVSPRTATTRYAGAAVTVTAALVPVTDPDVALTATVSATVSTSVVVYTPPESTPLVAPNTT